MKIDLGKLKIGAIKAKADPYDSEEEMDDDGEDGASLAERHHKLCKSGDYAGAWAVFVDMVALAQAELDDEGDG